MGMKKEKKAIDWFKLESIARNQGMTLKEICSEMGYKSNILSQAKSEKDDLDITVIKHMCRILGCQEEAILYCKTPVAESSSVIPTQILEELSSLKETMRSIDNRCYAIANVVGEVLDYQEQDHTYCSAAKQFIRNALQIHGRILDKDMSTIKYLTNLNEEEWRMIKSELKLTSISCREGKENKEVRYWKIETGIRV